MKSPTNFLLVLAGSVHLAACAEIVFPFVKIGAAGENANDFQDFQARVMDVQNDLTTYSVGCITTNCAGWGNLPSTSITWTMAIGPSTFDWKFSDLPHVSSHSACKFTGSPATAASCEATMVAVGQTTTIENEYHFTVPGATGKLASYNVVSATLKVVDGTVESTTASTTASAATETGSVTGTNSASTTTTRSESGSAVSTGGGTAPSSAFARETGAPAAKWVVGVGAAIGAAVVA